MPRACVGSNHAGQYFNVSGPLNMSRPPQGYPVLIQAGSSEAGRELAAQVAEVIFTVHEDKGVARAFAEDIRARAGRYGRDPVEREDHAGRLPDRRRRANGRRAPSSPRWRRSRTPPSHCKVLADRLGHDLERLRPGCAGARAAALGRHARPCRDADGDGAARQADSAAAARSGGGCDGSPACCSARPSRSRTGWRTGSSAARRTGST